MVQRRHNVIAVTLNSTTAPAVDHWFGYAIRETAGAAETILFKDGTSTGALLWPERIGANGSRAQVWVNPLHVPSGVLHVDSTGSIAGVVLI